MEHPRFGPVWRDVPFLYFIFHQLCSVEESQQQRFPTLNWVFFLENTRCLVPLLQFVLRRKFTRDDFHVTPSDMIDLRGLDICYLVCLVILRTGHF